MMKTSVESAKKLLDFKVKKEEIEKDVLERTRKEASDTVEEIIASEKEAEDNVKSLASLMENSDIYIKPSDTEEDVKRKKVEDELNHDITMNNDGDDITITDTIGPGEDCHETRK